MLDIRNDLHGPSRTFIVEPVEIPRPQEVPAEPARKDPPVKAPEKEPVPA